jgi:V/A-type H+-transporting ATPase subunit I
MAIDQLKKVSIVCPKRADRRLIRTINRLGAIEVVDSSRDLEDAEFLTRCEMTSEEADEKLYKVDFILNLMNSFIPERIGFWQGLTTIPLVTNNLELNAVLEEYDIEDVFKVASELDETYRSTERIIGDLEKEIDELEPFAAVPFDLADFFGTKRTRLFFGLMARENIGVYEDNARPWDRIAWEILPLAFGEADRRSGGSGGGMVTVVIAAAKQDGDEVYNALAGIGFEEIALPRLNERVSERLEELKDMLGIYQRKLDEVADKVRQLLGRHRAGEGRRPLVILKAYWLNAKDRIDAYNRGVQGKWLHILSGYIRTRDVPRFVSIMERDFPDAMITLDDPAPDEDVPVSITVHPLFRPAQLLVEMFGLPSYRSFDPTPFVQANFYVFFGICFSDVFYGIMLSIAGALLSARTKPYRGLNNFAMILFYGGLSSTVFGAITGSWFGDLYRPEYLGDGNLLMRIRNALVVLDPMEKTILALLSALAIGILNQFYGISLRMYSLIRQKDWLGAFSDGVCWLGALSGLIILVSCLFADIPRSISRMGLWLFAISSLCLVMTQARGIENPLGRIAAGIVSLYGIVGSYGVTAFVGDVLSYCRLLALGLTTSIVAMAFNLMAGMVKGLPYVGLALFVIVLVIGHIFNFGISVLGSFVHSMRLVYVEFFGRFYEPSGRPFKPLCFGSPLCILDREVEKA